MFNNPVTQFHHMHQTARYSCSSDCVTVYTCVHTHTHVVLPWQHSIQCSYLPTDTQRLQPLYTNQTADWAAPKWFPQIPQLDSNILPRTIYASVSARSDPLTRKRVWWWSTSLVSMNCWTINEYMLLMWPYFIAWHNINFASSELTVKPRKSPFFWAQD